MAFGGIGTLGHGRILWPIGAFDIISTQHDQWRNISTAQIAFFVVVDRWNTLDSYFSSLARLRVRGRDLSSIQ